MVFSRGRSKDGDVARNTYTWPNEYKGENIMYRLPTNIYYNDNIIVMEDEFAVFLRDGKAMHVFDQAGRYALTTQNVPILREILPKLTGVKQLGEVYYIQRRELRGKFGTPEPLTFRDADFGLVRLRVFGQFSYKVVEPMLFITQFVGTRGWSGSDEVIEWLRSELIQSVNDVLGELKRDKNMAVVDMPAYVNEIEQLILGKIDNEAKRYGLDITNLAGITITPPPEVQAAIDRRGAMGALGVNYMEYQTGKAIEGVGEGAAKGGGNATAAMAGLGAGAGIGIGMGGAMGQGMQQGSSQKQVMVKCQECGALVAEDAKFCKECGKSMVKAGTVKCPKCGDANTPDAKFCDECGAPMKVKCPKCGKEQAGAKFCNECGTQL
ncbi:MAG: SPFH domain-containing protein [Thermoplasmata archaeon]